MNDYLSEAQPFALDPVYTAPPPDAVAQLSDRFANFADAATRSEGVAAVLHVAAVVTVLTLAYLRLDHDQSADRGTRELREAAVREAARDAFNGLEITPESFASNAVFGNLGTLYPAYVLAVMMDAQLQIKRVWRAWYFVARQRRIPLFVFYRERHHLHLVSLTSLFGTSILLSFGLGSILHWEWIDTPVAQLSAFSVLATSILMVVLTSIGSAYQQEKRLKKTCEKLRQMGDQRREEWQRRKANERNLYSTPPDATQWELPPQGAPPGPQKPED